MKSVPHAHPLPSPMPQLARMLLADQPLPAVRAMPGLRLRLKPKASVTGYVDGGWWPRSRDLSVELPTLVHVLAVRLGRVIRVAFALETWDTPPRQLTVDGNTLRLEGFHSQDQYVLHVAGSDGQRLSLLVIPPEASAAAAHDAMMTASRRGNADRPVEILAAGGIVPDTTILRLRLVSDDPQSHWDTDGGHIQE
ncbi:MAG TPA: DUF5994 family protein [Pseudonocardiaceae bacterium]